MVIFNKWVKNKTEKTLSDLFLSITYELHDAFFAKSLDVISLGFSNKKVVVIGPGEGPTAELALAVNSADICVLINKGYRAGHFYNLAREAKEVVLFHCLDEDEEVGGGALDKSILASINIREIIYPLSEKKLHPLYLRARRKLKPELKIITVKKGWYNHIVKQLDGYRPNTGFAALALLIKSNCDNLFIHGFTFYRTTYNLDYGNTSQGITDTIMKIESGANHNPDKDFQLFKRLIQGRDNIQLSDVMKSIISTPFESMFYR